MSPVLGGRFLTTGPPNEVFFWGGLSGNHCFERRSPRAFLCPGDLPLPYLIYVGGRKTKSQGEIMWEKQSPGSQTTHCPGPWLSSASPLLRFWIFLDDFTTTSIQSLNGKRDFPGGPAVKTVLPMQGAWAWSQGRELRSRILSRRVKKKKGKKSNGELRFSFSQINHQMFTSGTVGTRNYPRWVGSRVLVV